MPHSRSTDSFAADLPMALSGRRHGTRCRAVADALEPRRFFAVVAWDGGAGTFRWDDAVNWSTDALPAVTDDVAIDVPGVAATIIMDNSAARVRSLQCVENFQLSGGGIGVSADSWIGGAFTYLSGAILDAGRLTIDGHFTWLNDSGSGNMYGPGTTVLRGGATFQPGYWLQLTEGHQLIIDCDATLTTAASNVGFQLSTSYTTPAPRITVTSGHTLSVYGPSNSTAFYPYGYEQPRLLIEDGATLHFVNDNVEPAQLGLYAEIRGTLEIEHGTAYLRDGGLLGHATELPVGTSLRLGGSFNFGAASGGSGVFYGGGLLDLRSGLHTFGSGTSIGVPLAIDNTVARFDVDAKLPSLDLRGTLAGAATVTIDGPFYFAGTLGAYNNGDDGRGGRTIVRGPTVVATPQGVPATGTIGEGRIVRFEGDVVFPAPVSGPNGTVITGGLGGSYQTNIPGRVELAAGHTMTLIGSKSFPIRTTTMPRPVMSLEAGSTLRMVDAGTVAIEWRVETAAAINVAAGSTLGLLGGGVALATPIRVPATSTLRLGQSFDVGKGSGLFLDGNIDYVSGSFVPNGVRSATSGVRVSGARLTVDADDTFAWLDLAGGSVEGVGALTVAGALTWTRGSMSGSGVTRVRGNSVITAANNGGNLLLTGGRSLHLEGNATFATGTQGRRLIADATGLISAASRIVIAAGRTLSLVGEASLGVSGSGAGRPILVVETGATVTHGGAGEGRVDWDLLNAGTVMASTGTLTIAAGTSIGELMTAAPSYRVAIGATLQFVRAVTTLASDLDVAGTVAGLATLAVNRGWIGLNAGADLTTNPAGGTFVNEGMLDLSPGSVFAVIGNVRLAGASQPIIRTELASATSFGRVTITGGLDLNSPDSTSRLDPDLVSGYDPAPGTAHAVITAAGGIINGFDGFSGGPTPGGNTLLVTRPDASTLAVDVGTGAPPAPPQILSQAFEFEAREAIAFQFSTNVSAFLSRRDYFIQNLTTGVTLPQEAGVLSYNTTSNQAVLTLTGQLPEGNYRLTVNAADIANAAGVPAGEQPIVVNFHVLGGDANRDRVVNFSDLVILAQNYGTSGHTFSQGNFDYSPDGAVGFADLVLLAQRYGTSLVPLMSEAAAAGAGRKGSGPASVREDVLRG